MEFEVREKPAGLQLEEGEHFLRAERREFFFEDNNKRFFAYVFIFVYPLLLILTAYGITDWGMVGRKHSFVFANILIWAAALRELILYRKFTRLNFITLLLTDRRIIYARSRLFGVRIHEIRIDRILEISRTKFPDLLGNTKIVEMVNGVKRIHLISEPYLGRLKSDLNMLTEEVQFRASSLLKMPECIKPDWLDLREEEIFQRAYINKLGKDRYPPGPNPFTGQWFIYFCIVSLFWFSIYDQPFSPNAAIAILFVLAGMTLIVALSSYLVYLRYSGVLCCRTNQRIIRIGRVFHIPVRRDIAIEDIVSVSKAGHSDLYGNVRMWIRCHGDEWKVLFTLDNADEFINDVQAVIDANHHDSETAKVLT